MRDLDTCKAEVFRRSEEKIKERTRMRRRALTMCVPLALCLVIGAVTWTHFAPDQTWSKAGQTEAVPQSTEHGSDGVVPDTMETPVENAGESALLRIDSSAAAELLESLAPEDCAIQADHDRKQGSVLKDYEEKDPEAYGDASTRFVLVTDEGEQTFSLSDGVLTCESKGWQRQLTAEEENTLRQTLKLPEKDG